MERKRDSKGRFVKATKEGLPSEWSISIKKLTPEQKKKVSAFYVKMSGQDCYRDMSKWKYLDSHNFSGNYIADEKPLSKGASFASEGTNEEITFEQFAKYVLREGIPEKWSLNINKLTTSQRAIVGDFFAQKSGHGCYKGISQWNYISSHNGSGQYILDDSIRLKGASYADCSRFNYITFEQFEKYVLTKEFTLPKKWCLKVTEENIKEVSAWRTCGACTLHGYVMYKGFAAHSPDTKGYYVDEKPKGTTEITTEQFRKYVLKEKAVVEKETYTLDEILALPNSAIRLKTQEQYDKLKRAGFLGSCDYYGSKMYALTGETGYWATTREERLEAQGFTIIKFNQIKFTEEKKMDKKITGYKLVKKEYAAAAWAVVHSTPYSRGDWDMHPTFQFGSDSYKRAEKAGVLDLWFAPMYEDQFPVGSFIYLENAESECRSGCAGVGNGVHEVVSLGEIATNGLLEGDAWTLKVSDKRGDVWRIAPKAGHSFRKATEKEIKDYKAPKTEIKGYEAVFNLKDETVSFGCKTFTKKEILLLDDILRRSGLAIEGYQSQVMEVAKYLRTH